MLFHTFNLSKRIFLLSQDHVLSEYAFLLDMQHNYGYLEENPPGGYDPREQLNDVTDPIVLQVKGFEKK